MVDMDGSSDKIISKVRVVLNFLDEIEVKYAFRFNFKATNNEVEYEALLVGLSIAAMIGADKVVARCDSQ